MKHRILTLLGAGLLAVAALGTTGHAPAIGGSEPAEARPAAAAQSAAKRRVVKHRARVRYCVVRRIGGRRVLRPRGCTPRCRVIMRRANGRRVVRFRPCRRPALPHTQRVGHGLVGALGSRTSVRLSESAPATVVPARRTGTAAPGGGNARTLVLYDTTGPYGWLGELYAISAANLASRFGSWTAQPVSTYTAGMVDAYTATIYLGSTYDEPLPDAFLDDVYRTDKPVVWIYDNIWSLANRHPDFTQKYGFQWWRFDTSDVNKVTYKGVALDRSLLNKGGIMEFASLDESKVQVLATAHRTDGTTLPWAIRSGNLTYIGENPFTYTSETDRDLAFVDMLFDVLAPDTPERHRALVRIEDITPNSDPAQLRAVADVLYARKIPFGFGVSPEYRDPLKANGTTTARSLRTERNVASALRYMQQRGGVMINHGLTHQYSNQKNPYDGVSGNDFEFYRVTENADHTLNFAGPVPEDSPTWARARMLSSNLAFAAAGFTPPTIWEFPHYSSSVNGYLAAAQIYPTRWERALYFSGLLQGGSVNYARPIGQRFPFVVRDVYGTTVLPENIGSFEPEAFYQFPVHTVDDIVAGAKANKVVRDGIAGFYYHPFWGASALAEALDRIKAEGYTFVSPTSID